MLVKDPDGPVDIFFSYAHEDEKLMDRVRGQLAAFERTGRIMKWHDRMIPPGNGWREQIDARLNVADIILLFMSPDFIESNYCYEIEGKRALERHHAGDARVIPVVLRPCPIEETPFGAIECLPPKARPVTLWSNRDEACLKVAQGVMDVVDTLIRHAAPVPPGQPATPPRPAPVRGGQAHDLTAPPASQPSRWSAHDTNRVIAATTACICIAAVVFAAIAVLLMSVSAADPVKPLSAVASYGPLAAVLAPFCYIPLKMLRVAMETGGRK